MESKNFILLPGGMDDLPEIIRLYNELNDALQAGVNYPGWRKHIYPNEDTAVDGLKTQTLYVVKDNNRVAGTVILNNIQPEAYSQLNWSVAADGAEVLVIHTLAVHPEYYNCGIAKELLRFAEELGVMRGAKSIRLDTYVNNLPAIKLYEKCGYTLIGEVDLGLSFYGLDLFKCYEKALA